MKQKIVMALALVPIALLAGCGGAPSDSEVRAALLKQAEASGAAMLGPGYKDVVAKAKVVGCAKADAGGYKCDVANTAGVVMNMRFVKTDAGWAVAN